jgi:hypothetical protein
MAEDGGDPETTTSAHPSPPIHPYTQLTDNDSGFMDFMQASGVARKSNIFGDMTNNSDRGSSSFSLLTSRFTDDKYLTPTTVEYEEYRELLENGQQVEAELENVLGNKNGHGYGESLPPHAYKYALTLQKTHANTITKHASNAATQRNAQHVLIRVVVWIMFGCEVHVCYLCTASCCVCVLRCTT